MLILVAGLGTIGTVLSAQSFPPLPLPAPPAPQDAVSADLEARIRALQREAEQLTAEADSVVAELRRLEQARLRRAEDARTAEQAAAEARARREAVASRLEELEARQSAGMPELRAQLVDLYKRGRGRHARALVGATSLRDLARARRAVTALVTINQRRFGEQQQIVGALAQERERLEGAAADLDAREREAVRARDAAERALGAHRALVARIESQRDLNRQYVRELQGVYERLVEDVTGPPGRPAPAAAPLVRGRLQWPVGGPVTGRFGDTAGRLGGSAVRNGIEVAADEGTPVVATHAGTVSFAGDYIGFGTLVVLTHGGEAYSLYGYLGGIDVRPGEGVAAGARLGRVGRSPAGPPALYFEVRVDGRSVDPVQWLEPRNVPALPGASR